MRTQTTSMYAATAMAVSLLFVSSSAVGQLDNSKIAFRGSGPDIYTIRPDGTEVTQITATAETEYYGVWSPDGTRLLFTTDRDAVDASGEVYVMNADGTGQTRLTDTAATEDTPVWSPDGTQIAFQTYRDGNGEIYIMNADGSVQTNLTSDPSADGFPAWSPDGLRIAFSSDRDGDSEIYVMDVNGANVTQLTTDPAIDFGADWSPDGSTIAFIRDPGGNRDVWAMAADGTNQQPLTTDTTEQSYPSWAPDGTRIAFRGDGNGLWVMDADGTNQVALGVSASELDWSPIFPPDDITGALAATQIAFAWEQAGNWDIYLAPADGASATRLTFDPASDQGAAWAPDRSRVAFHSFRDGDADIYVVNADGTSLTQLTNDPGEDMNPSWSPDGSQIAFHTTRTGNGDIYVMGSDGSNPANITNDPGGDSLASWAPDGAQIAFLSTRDGNANIYVMDTTGANQRALTTDPAHDSHARWSPDGTQIAFWSDAAGTGDIYVMDAAGTTVSRLTTHGGWDVDPAWSPDGLRIAFTSDRTGLDHEVFVMNADGSNLFQLTHDTIGAAAPNWSSLAGPIASVSATSVDAGIATVGASTTATFDVTNTGAGLLTVTGIASDDPQFTATPTAFTLDSGLSQTVTVTFMPTVVGWETATLTMMHDGSGATTVAASGVGSVTPPIGDLTNTRIAFTTRRDGDDEIYAMDVTATAPLTLGNPVNLTNSAATIEGHAAWSPDGSRIVYASGGALEVRNTDGTGIPTPLGVSGFFTRWSPDGTQIVYGGAAGVSVVNPDGSGAVDLTADSGYSPVWSPDGAKIAYLVFEGEQHVRVIRADGSNPVDVPNPVGIEPHVLAWLPDGARFTFIGTENTAFDIFTMDADGSDVVNVSNGTLDSPLITHPISASPDGSRLAFTNGSDVAVIPMDGSAPPAIVVADPSFEGSVAWSKFLNLGDVTFTVPDAQGQIGSVAVIPITVTDVTGMAVVGIELTLTYDATLLTPQDDGLGNTTAVTLGPSVIPGTWSVQQHVATPGELKIAMAGDFATPAIGLGELLSIAFDISPTATAGVSSLMSLTQTRVNEGVITSAAVDGTFTVLSLVYGDVTGNGDVSALDAAWVLEHVVNESVSIEIPFPIEETAPTWAPSPLTMEDAHEVADVDDDTFIMALDASAILQFLVELIPSFPAEGAAAGTPSARVAASDVTMNASATAYRAGGTITVSLGHNQRCRPVRRRADAGVRPARVATRGSLGGDIGRGRHRQGADGRAP